MVQEGSARLDLMLRPSTRHSRSQILVSEDNCMRLSHVSVDPACRVSIMDEVTASGVTEWDSVKSGNQPEDWGFTREEISRVSVTRDFRHNSLVLVQNIKPRA